MNKAQLIDALAQRLGDKRTAGAAVDGLVDVIVRTVHKGEKVNITGFGVFEKRARAARMARNPRTGESVRVRKTNVPAFRAGTTFKDVVSGAKKLPRVSASSAAAGGSASRSATTAAGGKAGSSTRAGTATRSATSKATPAARSTASKAATTTKTAPAKTASAKASTVKSSTAAKPASSSKAAKPVTKKSTAKKK